MKDGKSCKLVIAYRIREKETRVCFESLSNANCWTKQQKKVSLKIILSLLERYSKRTKKIKKNALIFLKSVINDKQDQNFMFIQIEDCALQYQVHSEISFDDLAVWF